MKRPTTRRAVPVKCPVLPIAMRISELWDAHSRAQELEKEANDEYTAEQIDKLRIAMEGMASFERARSLSGALFQIALATEAANSLLERFPADEHHNVEKTVQDTHEKLIRLLESVALLLREKTAPEEFVPVQRVIRLYLDVDGDIMIRPFKWMDDIPQLAKEYGADKTA